MTPNGRRIFLIVGLGNPGSKYEMTRHNLGYLVVQAFAERAKMSFKRDLRFNASVAKGEHENRDVRLLLPLTFMNLSGVSLKRYVDYYKIAPDNIIVVSDDIALNFGRLRLKLRGSSGGHNGLKSVEEHLGTSAFMRLRMGVGHFGEKILADYVLEPFNETEKKDLQVFIDAGAETLFRLLREDVSSVMNSVNTIPGPLKISQEPDKETKDLTKPPLAG